MNLDQLLPLFQSLQGRVNTAEFMGKRPGTVLVAGTKIDARGAEVELKYDPQGWNNAAACDGFRYPVLDGHGRTLFNVIDFPAEGGFVYVPDWADEPMTVEAK